ncbi:MAG: cyclic nucleotide-binding domain-containing protein [Nitratireductor sp.]|nr:cyclic nucleotide-binding domain-containing protein [Nitratireductor sp.]MCC0021895.1 cyclic nucleotide-binding domain-containing protein [Nitratireductor sp.]
MTLADDIQLLSRVPLFDGFPEEQLRLLAFGSKRMFMRSGEALYLQDAVSDGGYVVVTGQVDLIVQSGQREIVLASYLANSLIGELALITANRRIATAVARGNCELVFIPRQLFRRMLEEYPELAERLQSRIMHSVQRMLSEMAKVQEKMAHIPDLSAKTDGDIESGQHEEG